MIPGASGMTLGPPCPVVPTTPHACAAGPGRRGPRHTAPGCRGAASRHGLYFPDAISIFLAGSFLSVLSPTETVRMPSR